MLYMYMIQHDTIFIIEIIVPIHSIFFIFTLIFSMCASALMLPHFLISSAPFHYKTGGGGGYTEFETMKVVTKLMWIYVKWMAL